MQLFPVLPVKLSYDFLVGITCREGFYAPSVSPTITANIQVYPVHSLLPGSPSHTGGKAGGPWIWTVMTGDASERRKTPPYMIPHLRIKSDKLRNMGN